MTQEPDPSSINSETTRRGTTLDRLAVGMFVLLALEFLLGMALALFVSLPTGATVVAVLTSTPVLDLHILLAVFLIGISLRALTIAVRTPLHAGLVASVLAVVSAVVATAAGWTFAFDGQAAGASYVMSVGFLGVLVAAFVLRSVSGPANGPRSDARPSPAGAAR